MGECYDGYGQRQELKRSATQSSGRSSSCNRRAYRALSERHSTADRAIINAQYGHDEVAEWEAGLEAPHPPEMEQCEQDEARHLSGD